MTAIERTEQLAVLLNVVGEEAAETILSSLEPTAAAEMKRVLAEFQSDPPTAGEVNDVLADFERYFSFALEQIQAELDGESSAESPSPPEEVTEESFAVEFEQVRSFVKPDFTGDTKLDLNLLHPYQVAYAIRGENPSAIAVVVSNLAEAHAAKTVELLPADVRIDVFLQLARPSIVSPKVEQQILEAALEAAAKVEQMVPEEDRTEQMTSLVRSLPKNIRTPLLEKLMEHDEQMAITVKSGMYRFDDLSRLDDRDVQKVLAQCDSDSLVISLAGAEDELKEKVLSNMSKRARQTIEDEMEFKTNVKPEEAELAEKQIVELIVRLDEEGEISFE